MLTEAKRERRAAEVLAGARASGLSQSAIVTGRGALLRRVRVWVESMSRGPKPGEGRVAADYSVGTDAV